MDDESYLAIVGPTGVGKTAFAIELAQTYGAELISADSRQVYVGMDIGTGKEVDQGDWVYVHDRQTLAVDGILIHGLNVVEPDQDFSVADWCRLAHTLIDEVIDRGKYPIIVGGTGFYLDAFQGKIDTLDIGPNQALRDELSRLTVVDLQVRLKKVDAGKLIRMNNSDRQNSARLIRAIEIAEDVSRLPEFRTESTANRKLHFLGLTMDRKDLLKKVDRRIASMVEQGFIEETRHLIGQYGDQCQAMTGIGYREMAEHLHHRLKLDEAVRIMQQRTHDYIKRQYTWFAKQPVDWVAVDQDEWRAVADQIARPHLVP